MRVDDVSLALLIGHIHVGLGGGRPLTDAARQESIGQLLAFCQIIYRATDIERPRFIRDQLTSKAENLGLARETPWVVDALTALDRFTAIKEQESLITQQNTPKYDVGELLGWRND